MDIARYVVDAVVLEGRSCREVARAHGISKSWVAKLVHRYREGDYEAIASRSRAPKSVPSRCSPEVEDQIVRLRKELIELGFDAGAQTIHYHLGDRVDRRPSASTVWRVLKRRGFITPQPQKKPRSSYIRFEASLPNECWQSDMTHWKLADGTEVDIVNFIDDFSRVAVSSQVFTTTTAPDVVTTFYKAVDLYGLPASVLADNGCIYTAAHRNGRAAMETELFNLGITYKHSRPYHPQTCGKVERFHQTLKLFLAKQPKARSVEELQAQIERFIPYYNEVRPHRAKGRKTPRSAFDSRDKATPQGIRSLDAKQMRVRHDKINANGTITLRYKSRLHHIGLGRGLRGRHVIVLVAGRDIRVLDEHGHLLRHLELDPTRDYQPLGQSDAATMSRDTCPRCLAT